MTQLGHIGRCAALWVALTGAAHAAPADTTDDAFGLPQGDISVPLPSEALREEPAGAPVDPVEFQSIGGSGQYKRCLDTVVTDPDAAFDMGLVWRDQGGGAPARHCIALALIELGHYGEAAVRLEELAKSAGAGDTALRVQILSQAGNAWLLQEQAQRAISAFGAGIALAATDAERGVDPTTLIYDRARSYALIEQWANTEEDLSTVLTRQPRSLSALVLRATARRQQGRMDAARQDIDRALDLSPEDPASLIERGIQRSASGDADGARRDWAFAAVSGEGTPLARAAQDLIAQLDLEGVVPGAPGAARPRQTAAATLQIAPPRPETGPQPRPQPQAQPQPRNRPQPQSRPLSDFAQPSQIVPEPQVQPRATVPDPAPRPARRVQSRRPARAPAVTAAVTVPGPALAPVQAPVTQEDPAVMAAVSPYAKVPLPVARPATARPAQPSGLGIELRSSFGVGDP